MDKFNEMLRRDDVWFQIAFGVAVLVFFTVIIGIVIAFLAGDSDAAHIGARIDIVYKLGLIGAGLITFCTVAWRGLLATQQVDAQRKQIEKLSSQIALTEESNLATLLQKGAELIADVAKPGHVSAGLATLRAVVTAPNPKFAIEAMNLVADYIQANHQSEQSGVAYQSAAAVLQAGHGLQRIAERRLKFEANEGDEDEPIYWSPVTGVRRVIYNRGTVFPDDFPDDMPKNMNFNYARIFGGRVSVGNKFSRCTFERCKIVKVDTLELLRSSVFRDCDFSGTKFSFSIDALEEDLRPGRNYFLDGIPPVSAQDVDWLTLLNTEKPPKDEIPF